MSPWLLPSKQVMKGEVGGGGGREGGREKKEWATLSSLLVRQKEVR